MVLDLFNEARFTDAIEGLRLKFEFGAGTRVLKCEMSEKLSETVFVEGLSSWLGRLTNHLGGSFAWKLILD
jgi:hypothetical protein